MRAPDRLAEISHHPAVMKDIVRGFLQRWEVEASFEAADEFFRVLEAHNSSIVATDKARALADEVERLREAVTIAESIAQPNRGLVATGPADNGVTRHQP